MLEKTTLGLENKSKTRSVSSGKSNLAVSFQEAGSGGVARFSIAAFRAVDRGFKSSLGVAESPARSIT